MDNFIFYNNKQINARHSQLKVLFVTTVMGEEKKQEIHKIKKGTCKEEKSDH